MPDIHILDTLNSGNEMLDSVAYRLDSLRTLFFEARPGDLVPTVDGFIYKDTVTSKTVFQDDNSNAEVVTFKRKGDIKPVHMHSNSDEYIIVVSGKIRITIDGVSRVMGKGECASIKRGMVHSCVALLDDSIIFTVCIPPEKAYRVEKTCQTFQEKSL